MNHRFSVFLIVHCIPVILFTGCTNNKIEITNEYIINENWNREKEGSWANSITIRQMKVRQDSAINPFANLSQSELLSKLEEDSSFLRFTNVRLKEGESYTNKRLYFNRDNGFYWGTDRFGGSVKVKTIGILKNGHWYKFSDLGIIDIQYIYVYVDSIGNTHRFDVWHTNY